MKRPIAIAVCVLSLVAASCGGGNAGAGSTTTLSQPSSAAPGATTAAPATTVTTTLPSVPTTGEAWDLSEIEIELEQPELWRAVSAPPDGADIAVYAPSDNNAVAERLLIKAVALNASDSVIAQVEDATNDLEAAYENVAVLAANPTTIGADQVPAQQLRFTWEQGTEAGVGWRWIAPAETQLIYITFLADLSEPSLYLQDVQNVLLTAVFGG